MQRGQQVALATADLQHPFSGRYQGLVDPLQATVVRVAETTPAVETGRDLIPVSDALLAIALACLTGGSGLQFLFRLRLFRRRFPSVKGGLREVRLARRPGVRSIRKKE